MPANRTVHVFDAPGVEAGAVEGMLAGRLPSCLILFEWL